jgi:hypothetical protein
MMMATCCGRGEFGERYNRGTLFETETDFSGSVTVASKRVNDWGCSATNIEVDPFNGQGLRDEL